MRRFALGLLVLAATGLLLTACTSTDWSDPFHPKTDNPTHYVP